MTFPLDTTGTAGSNAVTSEAHLTADIYASTFSNIFLVNGPFYSDGLVLTYTPTGGVALPLMLDLDYELAYLLPNVANGSNLVYGAIKLLNSTLVGSINVAYQALGGSWVFDLMQIYKYQNETYFNNATDFIALVLSPSQYPLITTLNLSTYSNIAASLAATSPIHLGIKILSDSMIEVTEIDAYATELHSVNLNSTVWKDTTLAPVGYYVRHETVVSGRITVSWVTVDGKYANPVIANLTPG